MAKRRDKIDHNREARLLKWTLVVLGIMWVLLTSWGQGVACTFLTGTLFVLNWLAYGAIAAPPTLGNIRDIALTVVPLAGLIVAVMGYVVARRRLDNEEKKRDDERYARAVEMLGHEQLTVRQGGIFELERLGLTGKSHLKQALHSLEGFMRDRSPAALQPAPEENGGMSPQSPENGGNPAGTAPAPCAQDIQDALIAYSTLLRMWDEPNRTRTSEVLSRNLCGVNFAMFMAPSGCYFAHCGLERCDLRGARLHYADLSDAHLNFTDLRESDLHDADLSRAFLRRAKLCDARLHDVDLTDADLEQADLTGAKLEDAHLRKASLIHAVLKRANLKKADLSRAVLWQAELEFANLHRAKLGGANLMNADLGYAKMSHTDVSGASLLRVNLSHARLSNINLCGVIFFDAKITLKWGDTTQPNLNIDGSRFGIEQAKSLHALGWPVLDRSKMLFFKHEIDAYRGRNPLSEGEVRQAAGLPPEPEGEG